MALSSPASGATFPFGKSLRTPTIGGLPLFRTGTLAHPDTVKGTTADDYADMLGAQYAQPVFMTGRGLAARAAARLSAASIRQAFLHNVTALVFADEAAGTLRTQSERLSQFHDFPVAAMLVCARFMTGVDEHGTAIWGEPALTVINAPSVPPKAAVTSSADMWPGVTALAPSKLRPPPADVPLFLLSATIAEAPRQYQTASKLPTSFSSFQDDLILTIDADRLLDFGWVVTSAPASQATRSCYLTQPPSPTTMPYLGPGQPPSQFTTNQLIMLCPRGLPLPFGHGIPTGQLYSPTLGSRGFLEALRSDAHHASASTKALMAWIDNDDVAKGFLDAVKAAPENFRVDFIARASIRDALAVPSAAHPTLTEESLSPFMWTALGVARKHQRDGIFSTLKTHLATSFLTFEEHQSDTVASDGSGPYGAPSLAGHDALFYLRPPQAKTWLERYGLTDFTRETSVPPLMRHYHVVALRTKKPANFQPMDLRTEDEMEEALHASANPPTPRSELARRMMGRTAATQQPGPQDSWRADESSFMTPRHGNVGASAPHVVTSDRLFPPNTAGSQSAQPPNLHALAGHAPAPAAPNPAAAFTNSGFGAWNPQSAPPHNFLAPTDQAPAPVAPNPAAAFTNAGFGAAASLSHLLQQANSATRAPSYAATFPPAATLPEPHRLFQQPAPQVPGQQAGSQSANAAFPPALAAQLGHLSGTMHYLADGLDRNVKQKLEYYLKDATSWKLDATMRKGPKNMHYLAAYYGRIVTHVPGRLAQAQTGVPPDWDIWPAELQTPWLTNFLVKDVPAQDAYYYCRKRIDALGRSGVTLGMRPTHIGASFFEKKRFEAFVSTTRWLSTPIRDASSLRDGSFTALDYVTLLPSRTTATFPAGGLAQHDMSQLLVQIKFLTLEATLPDHLAGLLSYGGQNTANTMFVEGLDTLLRALEHFDVKEYWTPTTARNCTALVFDLFEQLHLALVQWVDSHFHRMSLFADVLPAAPAQPAILMVNPTTTSHGSARTIKQVLTSWSEDVNRRLISNLRTDTLMHPAAILLDCIFEKSKSAGKPHQDSQQYPTPAPAPWAPNPFAPAPYPSQQYPPPLAPAPAPKAPGQTKGEKKLPSYATTPRSAVVTLLKWTDPEKAETHGSVLMKLARDHKVYPPNVPFPDKDGNPGEKAICFAFCVACPANGKVKGCNGCQRVRKTKSYVPCDRAHVDPQDPYWAPAPKETYAEIWKFLQHDAVKPYYSPTNEFAALMA